MTISTGCSSGSVYHQITSPFVSYSAVLGFYLREDRGRIHIWYLHFPMLGVFSLCTEITLEHLVHFVLRTGHLSHLPPNDHVNQQTQSIWRHVASSAWCLLSLLILLSPNGSVGLIIPSRSARLEARQLILQPRECS